MSAPKNVTPKFPSKRPVALSARLPKIDTPESIDVSMLDVMPINDFLALLKTKTESNSKELWKETCAIAHQLKAARELLSIGSNLISNRANKKILDRLVEVTSILLSAERVYLLEVDAAGKELIVTHTADPNALGIKIPISEGIEGRIYSIACALR